MTRLQRDLDEILERSRDDLEALRGARIFVTGGTGFVGSWMLESFVWANDRLALGARACVLTRDADAFARRVPHVGNDASVTLVIGDVREPARVEGTFDAIVHAATPASAKINAETPHVMVNTIVDGMRSTLDLAERSGAIPFLFTSSGAVYGRQPLDRLNIDETYSGAPDQLDPANAYHEAKRLSELQLAIGARASGIGAKVARLFAFVGPYLPLDRHFAIGNFIRDVMAAETIEILGDGTPLRSYLYAGDMTSWLWRVLVRGESGRAYNVGSERILSIAETALAVASCVEPEGSIVVRGVATGAVPERYVPSTQRARNELGLAEWTSLEESIRRTIAFARA